MIKNLVGCRFGRLIVVSLDRCEKNAFWKCVCDCGTEKVISAKYLSGGNTMSCGCLKKEVAKQNGYKTKHGKSRTPLYHLYHCIKDRCYNKENRKYKDYGGRGIYVCKEWQNDFTAFEEWANKNGYMRGLSIDRIDNNSGYSPDNCRFTNANAQNNNRRQCNYIIIDGNKKTVSEWAECFGISKRLAMLRYWQGVRGLDLFRKPHRGKKINQILEGMEASNGSTCQ